MPTYNAPVRDALLCEEVFGKKALKELNGIEYAKVDTVVAILEGKVQPASTSPCYFADCQWEPQLVAGVGCLFDVIGTDEFYPRLLEFLRIVADFDDVVVIKYRAGASPTVPYTTLSESTAESFTTLVQGLYLQSPFYGFCRKGEKGLNVLCDIAPGSLFESGLDQQCMKPVHLIDEAGYAIQSPDDGPFYLFSLGRTDDSTVYSKSEIEALEHLEPIVEQALLRHERLCSNPAATDAAELSSGKLGRSRLNALASESLTEREQEIVGYLVRGYSSKACARKLGISPATERVHRKNIYDKLGVRSQSELLASVLDSLLAHQGFRFIARLSFAPLPTAGAPP